MSDLARALLDELADDPVALARLRELVGGGEDRPISSASAYTTRTLAAELDRTERSILAAINRGELHAVRRGRGYVISAGAVADWARGEARLMTRRAESSRPRRRRSRKGPMSRALARDRAGGRLQS